MSSENTKPTKPSDRVLSLRSRSVKVNEFLPKVTRRKKERKSSGKNSKSEKIKSPILALSKKRNINEALDENEVFDNGLKDSPIVMKNLKVDEKSPISKRIDRLKGQGHELISTPVKLVKTNLDTPKKVPVSPSMISLEEDTKTRLKVGGGEAKDINIDKLNCSTHRQNLSSNIEKITFTIKKWTEISKQTDENRPEHIIDEINTNIGKFNLILTSKFKQFKILIEKVEKQIKHDGQLMSSNDLEGLWDNIERQIDQIFECFNKLEILKENGWKELEVKFSLSDAKSAGNTKSVKKKTKANDAASKARIKAREQASRDRMAKMKKAMLEKKRLLQEKESAEGCVTEGKNGAVMLL